MLNYMVRFIGVIDENKRPANFPSEVIAVGTYQAESLRDIRDKINEEFSSIINNQGMIVNLDSSAILDPTKINVEGRIYVPMHMMTYLRSEIKQMQSMPEVDEESDKDGNRSLVYYVEGKKVKPS